jgi:hypothetical protein
LGKTSKYHLKTGVNPSKDETITNRGLKLKLVWKNDRFSLLSLGLTRITFANPFWLEKRVNRIKVK